MADEFTNLTLSAHCSTIVLGSVRKPEPTLPTPGMCAARLASSTTITSSKSAPAAVSAVSSTQKSSARPTTKMRLTAPPAAVRSRSASGTFLVTDSTSGGASMSLLRLLCLSLNAPVHGTPQLTGTSSLCASRVSACGSAYLNAPKESISSKKPLKTMCTLSWRFRASVSASPIGGKNFEPTEPCTQCEGNGPPSLSNEQWSTGW
mmetsp:Transcript_7255/g.25929  ORF Transcript_7255/g.25929 Transcript_7255/m.25929 type:complete len:205 (-) Transcript_7255:322-936(-)